MADIAAANVTYSFNNRDKFPAGRLGWTSIGTISFGNGSLTYPSGGIPLTKGKMGAPRVLRRVRIVESNAALYTFEHDVSADTIRLFFSAGFTPIGTVNAVTGNVAAPTITLAANSGNIGADLTIGVNAVANSSFLESSHTGTLTGITGIQAPAFTGDAPGFVGTANAAAKLVELTTQAVAACVLQVEVLGY